MRRLIIAAAVLLSSTAVRAQLTCATSSSDQCNAVHYHVQAWNPDTKQYAEIYGHNQSSTTEACEVARKAEAAMNQSVVDYLLKTAPRLKVQAAKFGPCHCDMTEVKTDSHYLDDDRRNYMMRRDREMKLAMVELLLDNGATTDHDLVRALISGASLIRSRVPYWSREVAYVGAKGDMLLDPTRSTMRETTVNAAKSSGTAGSNLELVAVNFDPELFGAHEDVASAGDATSVNAFINAEMARVTAVLQAESERDDPDAAILEACNERIQLLTNLGKLAESAGDRSRLADALRTSSSDAERMKVVQTLFGDTVAKHWAPARADAMAVAVPAEISNDPVAVLRDSTGRYAEQQRKLALYAFMSRNSSLTESQEIWLSGIANESLAR
jgi:hypothetical protein